MGQGSPISEKRGMMHDGLRAAPGPGMGGDAGIGALIPWSCRAWVVAFAWHGRTARSAGPAWSGPSGAASCSSRKPHRPAKPAKKAQGIRLALSPSAWAAERPCSSARPRGLRDPIKNHCLKTNRS